MQKAAILDELAFASSSMEVACEAAQIDDWARLNRRCLMSRNAQRVCCANLVSNAKPIPRRLNHRAQRGPSKICETP